jgi:GNAT superfamily N-acetyltransferase
VDIKSLGYRTDIMLRLLEGSERTDRGDYVVIRSPANPAYWWGNFLLMAAPPAPGGAVSWRSRPPPDLSQVAQLRPLAGSGDWQQAVELRAACYRDDPATARGFLENRVATQRELTEAGHGRWFGAFTGGTLVAQLGIISDGRGVARYQDVETHPAARRQGLAGALVRQAGRYALAELAARTLVIVADPAGPAVRIYRAAGFEASEDQLSWERPPAP